VIVCDRLRSFFDTYTKIFPHPTKLQKKLH